MKCCNNKLANPDIVDGTAYFVCPECGNVQEVENYRVYTTEEAFSYFEDKYGFILPKEYVQLSGTNENWVVKLPSCDKEPLKYYFGSGFYETGSFASVDPNDENSICNNINSGREWGLPNTFVPLEGDGHTWLALDYSVSSKEPKVVVTETDSGNSLVVSNSFNEFVSNLLKYEDVYDSDGNIIYKEKDT